MHTPVDTLKNRAEVFLEKGKKNKAKACYQLILVWGWVLRDVQPCDLFEVLSELAEIYVNQRQWRAATRAFKRALTIAEKKIGLVSPEVVTALGKLAFIYQVRAEMQARREVISTTDWNHVYWGHQIRIYWQGAYRRSTEAAASRYYRERQQDIQVRLKVSSLRKPQPGVRPLLAHYRVVYLDGIHFTVRHGEKTDSTMILTALGVDLKGNREVLALRASAEESQDDWSALLQDLRNRGVKEIDLLVTDGDTDLLSAITPLFPAARRQHCLVQKQRLVMSTIPKRERQGVMTDLKGIWMCQKEVEARVNLAAFKAKYHKRYPEAVRSLCEDEEHLLTFYAFPKVMYPYIRSTNAIESLFSKVRKLSTSAESCARLMMTPTQLLL
jgi:tetratricopeptide (TPR) repeat protein